MLVLVVGRASGRLCVSAHRWRASWCLSEGALVRVPVGALVEVLVVVSWVGALVGSGSGRLCGSARGCPLVFFGGSASRSGASGRLGSHSRWSTPL